MKVDVTNMTLEGALCGVKHWAQRYPFIPYKQDIYKYKRSVYSQHVGDIVHVFTAVSKGSAPVVNKTTADLMGPFFTPFVIDHKRIDRWLAYAEGKSDAYL